MEDQAYQAQALRRRAADYARRASTASDPVIEHGYRRRAHHYLARAAELGASGTAEQGSSAEDHPLQS